MSGGNGQPAGATVRRLHRERATAAGSLPGRKRSFGRRRPNWNAYLASGSAAEARRGKDASDRPPGRGDLLLRLGAIIGPGDALVVDGHVLRLLWRMPRPGEDFAEVQRERRAVEEVGELRELLTQLGTRHHRVLIAWANSESIGPILALGSAGASKSTRGKSHSVEQFVHQCLIPRLQAEGLARLPLGGEDDAEPGGEGDGEGPALTRSGVGAAAEEMAEGIATSEGLQHFALQGDTYYRLVPFYGRPRPGQVHVRWRGLEFVGVDKEPRAQAVVRFDRHMSTIAREVFRHFEPERPQWKRHDKVLYEDHVHSVVVQAGQVYCCRKIPPYVVEAPDRKLHRFGGVTVGVPIPDVEPTAVLRSAEARVMHEYKHMFVLGGAGASICMPRPAAFYQKLQKLPLEDGIVELLESARLTMCSGYFQGSNAPFSHPTADMAPHITASEAGRKKLPIYRFYRSRGSHSVMLRWW